MRYIVGLMEHTLLHKASREEFIQQAQKWPVAQGKYVIMALSAGKLLIYF